MNAYEQKLHQAKEYLTRTLPAKPDVALILGTGLGVLEEAVEAQLVLDYGDIPHFRPSTAPSHAGRLVFGRSGRYNVVVLSGRLHDYEGYDADTVVFPLRVLRLMGLQAAILTNGCGCLNLNFDPGDYMLLKDHLSFFAASPCRGENLSILGPRFFDITPVYDVRLRQLAMEHAQGLPLTLREGVYAYMPGPEYETAAEVRALVMMGADAVGMSTVQEATAAAHCGLPVLAISHLANMAVGLTDAPVDCSVVQNDKTPLVQLIKRLLEDERFLPKA